MFRQGVHVDVFVLCIQMVRSTVDGIPAARRTHGTDVDTSHNRKRLSSNECVSQRDIAECLNEFILAVRCNRRPRDIWLSPVKSITEILDGCGS